MPVALTLAKKKKIKKLSSKRENKIAFLCDKFLFFLPKCILQAPTVSPFGSINISLNCRLIQKFRISLVLFDPGNVRFSYVLVLYPPLPKIGSSLFFSFFFICVPKSLVLLFSIEYGTIFATFKAYRRRTSSYQSGCHLYDRRRTAVRIWDYDAWVSLIFGHTSSIRNFHPTFPSGRCKQKHLFWRQSFRSYGARLSHRATTIAVRWRVWPFE